MNLYDILSQDAFWQINKKIAKKVGIEASLLLSDLITKERYFKQRGELKDGYFYNTSDNIGVDTTLTYHKQKQALKILKELGFVDTVLKGVPAKLHFKVVENKILKFLNTGIEKIQKLDSEKFETNKNKEIRINNKNKEINKSVSLPFDSDEFKKAWGEWKEYKSIEHRFKFKSELSENKALTALNKLSSEDESTAINIIDNAISQGWQGLYLPKTNGKQQPTPTKSSQLFIYKINGEQKKHSDQKRWERDKANFEQVDCYEEIEIRK